MSLSFDVLYVEDCVATVELLDMCLNRYGSDINLSLDVASTFSQVSSIYSVDKHVAALIDWNLPDGKGTDVATFLRAQNKNISIIFLSALFTENLIAQASIVRGSICLEKDYTPEFVSKITEHIASR